LPSRILEISKNLKIFVIEGNNYKKVMSSLYIMHFSVYKLEREFLKYIRDRGEDQTDC